MKVECVNGPLDGHIQDLGPKHDGTGTFSFPERTAYGFAYLVYEAPTQAELEQLERADPANAVIADDNTPRIYFRGRRYVP